MRTSKCSDPGLTIRSCKANLCASACYLWIGAKSRPRDMRLVVSDFRDYGGGSVPVYDRYWKWRRDAGLDNTNFHIVRDTPGHFGYFYEPL